MSNIIIKINSYFGGKPLALNSFKSPKLLQQKMFTNCTWVYSIATVHNSFNDVEAIIYVFSTRIAFSCI